MEKRIGKHVLKSRKAVRALRRKPIKSTEKTRKEKGRRRVAKRGGMPLQYFGGVAPANLTANDKLTTACKMPKSFGNCFKQQNKSINS